MKNVHEATVAGFGDEWSRFTQDGMTEADLDAAFELYFRVFPWDRLPEGAVGCDFGCGSGRWAARVAPRVGRLTMLDASDEALAVAKHKLAGATNVDAVHASVSDSPFADASLDFAYSLGVLHHVPDTEGALREIARTLKPGAPFLTYMYYAFDNRPAWFRGLWKTSDIARRGISRLPHGARYAVSQALAGLVYWPLARTGKLLDRVGLLHEAWPLRYYVDHSFYVMRTDALDRFGTQLEKRFTRAESVAMLERAGFENVRVSEDRPHWTMCAVRTS
jgi:ubiquinone/menaquinone biosynthesis C-methylase UbiE